MAARERYEALEKQILCSRAALASESRGREREEEPCAYRTAFQRDRDRILHCKAFRRLKHKTQVFLSPEGDHYRTRLTHTLEVSQIARTIARALQLNEDLTEAISLGHDLGHTPFGHAGERAQDGVMEGGFRHYEQSVRVVEKLENDGAGLNLTWEVRDGILRHTCGEQAATLEGRIVRLADRVAYINHDIDDAVRAGVLAETDVPAEIREALGDRRTTRIDRLVTSIVENSGEISGWTRRWRDISCGCMNSCFPPSTAIRWPKARRARWTGWCAGCSPILWSIPPAAGGIPRHLRTGRGCPGRLRLYRRHD